MTAPNALPRSSGYTEFWTWTREDLVKTLEGSEIGTLLVFSRHPERDRLRKNCVWIKVDRVSWKRHDKTASNSWMTFFGNENMADEIWGRVWGDWWALS